MSSNYYIFDTDQSEHLDSYKIKITKSNKFEHNDFVLVNDTCRVAQELSHLQKHWRGENCLDIETGFDYPTFFKLWNSNRRGLARSMVVEMIDRIPDIVSIDILELTENRETRTLEISYQITTAYGIIKKG